MTYVKKVYDFYCYGPLKRMANTPWVLLVGVLLTYLVASVAFIALETHTWSPSGFVEALYWASTTMTSVGYGDLTPASVSGRLMTIVFQNWAMFVVLPCAIVNIIEAVKVDKKALTHKEQEYLLAFAEAMDQKFGLGLGPQPHDYED